MKNLHFVESSPSHTPGLGDKVTVPDGECVSVYVRACVYVCACVYVYVCECVK